jgi:hypothetical protein
MGSGGGGWQRWRGDGRRLRQLGRERDWRLGFRRTGAGDGERDRRRVAARLGTPRWGVRPAMGSSASLVAAGRCREKWSFLFLLLFAPVRCWNSSEFRSCS